MENNVEARREAGSATDGGRTFSAKDVSVVVCTYTERRSALLREAIAALASNHPAPEIIVVVDHNERLYTVLRAEYPDHVVTRNDGARGLSAARNCGLALAQRPIVAFLDDDAVPDGGWAAALAAAYGPDVVGVGGYIEPDWEAPRPGWFPAEFDWVVGCTYVGSRRGAGPVRNMLGANMSFRADELRAIGGFRDGMGRVGVRPLGCEETEACIRMGARRPDREIRFNPACRVRHRVPADRATFRYLLSRCWSEGLSKAEVARLAGRGPALSDERKYVARALPRAVLAAVWEGFRRCRPLAWARAFVIVSGLAVTIAGYVTGRVSKKHRTVALE